MDLKWITGQKQCCFLCSGRIIGANAYGSSTVATDLDDHIYTELEKAQMDELIFGQGIVVIEDGKPR